MIKAEYQRRIWTYKKRRDVYRRKCHLLSQKIRQWNECLRNRKREDKKRKLVLGNLINKINEYFEVNIRSKSRNINHRLARNIYYKIGLELKYSGSNLSRFIGRSKKMAARGRKQLLASFKSNKQNIEAYHNFKKYFEN